jgi:hypothetical protein
MNNLVCGDRFFLEEKVFSRIVLRPGVGFLLPWTAVFIYLGVHGALRPFLDNVFNYNPLFSQMNYDHAVLSTANRIIDNVRNF